MICIVSGPSCSGKSTFLRTHAAGKVSCIPPSAPVIYPARGKRSQPLPICPCFFHYNLLRPADALYKAGTDVTAQYTDFSADRAWKTVSLSPLPKKAIVLVAGKRDLLQRMTQRRRIGENFIFEIFNPRYKSDYWVSLLHAVDLAFLYAGWIRELHELAIDTVLLDASSLLYKTLDIGNLDLESLNA
jgi:hypothetical protein